MSKIEKSDSWASWFERIRETVTDDKTFWGGMLMSFASSFIAPIKYILGLPLTIILFTGFGAALFLIISLLWRDYKENKGLKNMKEQKNIEFEDKIRSDIIVISDKCTIGEINHDQAKKMIEARVALVAEEIKAIKPLMKVLCGSDGEYSKDDYDKFYSVWKNFQPLQKNVANLLLTRATPRIPTGEISKQAIEFLLSITDSDLEILKKQFKYVLELPHQDNLSGLSSKDLVICYYQKDDGSKVQNILLKENVMYLQSYSIDFYGSIWHGEEGERISIINISQERDICDINNEGVKKKLEVSVNNNQTVRKELYINLDVFTCLTKIGAEIYSLLKDELDSAPSEYLNNLIEYWNKKYPALNFKLVDKIKLITNDNT